MWDALRALWQGTPPVASAPAFRAFLDAQAAFAAQKSVLPYCEVKAGLNRERLFAEADFKRALDRCRWESFAAVLADLLVLAHARLAEHGGGGDLADALAALYAAILEAHPRPDHRPAGWDDLTAAFPARLAAVRLEGAADPGEVARTAAARVLDTLPIHPAHRRHDREAIVGGVRFQIVAAWEAMERRVDAAAVAADLLRTAPARRRA
ncbi:hypothetical protein [Azospirillum sp. ST 5-10]|uniref:hypothetical protein n=1 Tax=unclassified Azospirillum TaxID=2630922 RepID=UPI003F4A0031